MYSPVHTFLAGLLHFETKAGVLVSQADTCPGEPDFPEEKH